MDEQTTVAVNEQQQLTEHVARNLAFYRKRAGLTQAELAEKINYSDKSVSKWERADGLPDVYVLTRIATLCGVTLDALVCADDPTEHAVPVRQPRRLSVRHRILIPLLAVGLVWLLAAVVSFVFAQIPNLSPKMWLAFVWAIPVSGVVLTVLSSLWWRTLYRFLSTSILVWGVALGLYFSVPLDHMGLVFIVAAVMQVLTGLWYLMKAGKRRSA